MKLAIGTSCDGKMRPRGLNKATVIIMATGNILVNISTTRVHDLEVVKSVVILLVDWNSYVFVYVFPKRIVNVDDETITFFFRRPTLANIKLLTITDRDFEIFSLLIFWQFRPLKNVEYTSHHLFFGRLM